MAQITDNAIILRTRPFSDTSIIAVVLTRSHGKVSVLAKGARRIKGGAGASLEPFTRAELVYYDKPGRSLQTLAKSAIVDSTPALSTSLGATAAANLAAECVDRLVEEGEPHSDVYAALAASLGQLEAGREPVATAAGFVVRLLTCLGYSPSLAECAECGGAVEGTAVLDPRRGGVLCPQCDVGAGGVTLSGGSLTLLRRLAMAGPPAGLKLAPGQKRELMAVAEVLIEGQLDRPLRSANFARQVLLGS